MSDNITTAAIIIALNTITNLIPGGTYTTPGGVTIEWDAATNIILVSEPVLSPIIDIRQLIDNAINKVEEAKYSLNNRVFEESENKMLDTVQLIAEILHLVNELEHPSPNDWSVFGIPLQIKDVAGKTHQIPTPNALIFLEDGSCLLVGTNVLGEIIDKAPYIANSAIGNSNLSPKVLEDYSTMQTEVYIPDVKKRMVAQGTVHQFFGW